MICLSQGMTAALLQSSMTSRGKHDRAANSRPAHAGRLPGGSVALWLSALLGIPVHRCGGELDPGVAESPLIFFARLLSLPKYV